MPAKRRPTYQLHKASGQAKVRIDGRDFYLGVYGSAESREHYDDLISEWFAKHGDISNYKLTVDDLSILFMRHAKQYYRKNGKPTSEVYSIRLALRPLIALFGTTRVRDFGPVKVKQARSEMIKNGCVRTSINRQVDRIKRMFKWGVENEYVPPSIYTALTAVAGLRAGRTDARETEAVKPVEEGTVSDTIPHLPRQVAAMVQLQQLTGGRPGEVCIIRPCDITMQTNGVWVFRPESHKTQHHGRERRIFIGPQGQEVLRPFLERDPEAYCFSPVEAEAERNAEKRRNRVSPMTPSQAARKPKANRKRSPRGCYTEQSYRRSIARACEKANVPSWSPNQLRHSRATIIRERYGIEAAQTVLGHSDPRTTEIYAERDFEMAARVMREIG